MAKPKLPFGEVIAVVARSFGRAPVASIGWCVAASAATSAASALVVLTGRAFASLGGEGTGSLAAVGMVFGVLAVVAIGVGASHAGLGWIAWELERGAAPSFDACARAVGGRMPSIARASVNVAAMCFAGFMCIYVGALIMAAAFCCALPMVACEGRSALEALDTGRRMAAPHEWRVLLLHALATPLLVVAYFVGMIAGMLLPGSEDASIRVAAMGSVFAGAFTFGAGLGFGTVASGIYVVLRRQIDEASIAAIARRFE